MTEAERKKFLEALEREADFQNAKELFGNGGLDENQSLDSFVPQTEADLERFCVLVSRKLVEVTVSFVQVALLEYLLDIIE